MRKAIRFNASKPYLTWPSRNHSFFENPNLRENTVVIPVEVKAFSLEFEGQNCKPWTRAQCRIIYKTLNALPFTVKIAPPSICDELVGIRIHTL